jgi:secreted PhoX family phosphatase
VKIGRRHALGLGAAVAILGGGAAYWRLADAKTRTPPTGLVRDPKGLLDLPAGFSYVVLDRAGDSLGDGHRVAARPDGMHCFPGDAGTLVLVRNHELLPDAALGPWQPGAPVPSEAFDPKSKGCVSRLVVDPKKIASGEQAVVASNLVIAGTNFNCAGGWSPWGWLSCEEDVDPGHGFVFICPPSATALRKAEPIRAYGRFRHEAVAIDPTTLVAYLTEDRDDACLYRFVPKSRAAPFEGRLEALAVAGETTLDTARDLPIGVPKKVRWVPVDDPAALDDRMRSRAHAAGAAVFRRLEGADFAQGSLVFTATTGGRSKQGQLFRFTPDGDAGTLELLYESHDPDLLSMPDNVVVSPWGDIFLAEDGALPCGIRCYTRRGEMRALASAAAARGELSGVTFSPDGSILFANLQADGVTVAIRGPFQKWAA